MSGKLRSWRIWSTIYLLFYCVNSRRTSAPKKRFLSGDFCTSRRRFPSCSHVKSMGTFLSAQISYKSRTNSQKTWFSCVNNWKLIILLTTWESEDHKDRFIFVLVQKLSMCGHDGITIQITTETSMLNNGGNKQNMMFIKTARFSFSFFEFKLMLHNLVSKIFQETVCKNRTWFIEKRHVYSQLSFFAYLEYWILNVHPGRVRRICFYTFYQK